MSGTSREAATLRSSIEVKGIETKVRSPSMRMSPGSRPNQCNALGANVRTVPSSASPIPVYKSTLPIGIAGRVYQYGGL